MIFPHGRNSRIRLEQHLDYRELYYQEREYVDSLERQLTISSSESKSLARELSNVYQHTKIKRRELAAANDQLVKYADDLRTTLRNLKTTHSELQKAYYDTIHRLVLASEYKDMETGRHITRISRYSALLAEKIGLGNAEVESISYASPMHDVGKIGIPDHIILKNGMLTEREFSIIKTHTTIGAGILENSNAGVLQTARAIALSHHERWDGSGYPSGLSGEKISIAARIVALSDTFDALTSKRPYKCPYPIDVSCDIIRKERGRHFDPDLVDLFLSSINLVTGIKTEIDGDSEPVNCSSPQFTWSERDRLALADMD